MPKEKPYATEADMCADFLARIDTSKWTAYNETAGWDILLVRQVDGFQIGIQAKLRFGVDVLNQAIEGGAPYQAMRCGPDCRAVLVPYAEERGFGMLAGYVGITVLRMTPNWNRGFTPCLPDDPRDNWHGGDEQWHECCPDHRHKLPEYVPDVRAGSPSPLQLTAWKIGAIKIAVTIDIRGSCTRADFKHHGIDYRRWIAAGAEWLTPAERKGHWKHGKYFPNFHLQHPEVYAKIKADWDKWKSPEPAGPLL